MRPSFSAWRLSLLAWPGVEGAARSREAADPPTVAVIKPKAVPLRSTKEFTGRLVTKDPVKVIPQITGRLVNREFKDGDDVEEGKTVLFRIDPVLYKADVEKAKADIAKAKADIDNWSAQIQRDRAEFERVKKTFDTGVGAKTDLDSLPPT